MKKTRLRSTGSVHAGFGVAWTEKDAPRPKVLLQSRCGLGFRVQGLRKWRVA